MANQLQIRRGTSTQNDAFTGLVSELSHDTQTNELRVHDGSTAGGIAQTLGGQSIKGLTALKARPIKNDDRIYLAYHTTAGDGGGGVFRAVTGAAAGTYTDNNGTIIVPTGGDGSAAWLRDFAGDVNVHWFGAIGDGVADDAPAIQAAVTAHPKSVIYIPGGKYLCKSAITLQIGTNIKGSPSSVAEQAIQGFSEGTVLYLSTTDSSGNLWTTTVINPNGETFAGRALFVATAGAGALGTMQDFTGYSLGANNNNSTFLYAGDSSSTVPYERGRVTQCHMKGLRAFTFNNFVYGAKFTDSWLVDVHTESCTTIFAGTTSVAGDPSWNVRLVNCLFWQAYTVFNFVADTPVNLSASNCIFDCASGFSLLDYGQTATRDFTFSACMFNNAPIHLLDAVNSTATTSMIFDACTMISSSFDVVEQGNFRIDGVTFTGCRFVDTSISANYKAKNISVNGCDFVNVSSISMKGISTFLCQGNNFKQSTVLTPLVFTAGVTSHDVLVTDNLFASLATPIDYSGLNASLSTARISNNMNVPDKEYSKNGKVPFSIFSDITYGQSVSGNWVSNAIKTFLLRNSNGAVKDVTLTANVLSDARSELAINNTTGGVLFDQYANWTSAQDNLHDLGTPTNRWGTVYAGTGVINTSDERLKQDIQSITEEEKKVAKELLASIVKYRFKDAVSKKGEKARFHIGVLAQKVISIFSNHGLDAFDYGLLCHDTWEDYTIHHKGVAEELDKNGAVIKTAMESYDEDVPSGDRYAIRYAELNLFLLSALMLSK